MPIKQRTTYYPDYLIQTYTEFVDEVEVLFKDYDRNGRLKSLIRLEESGKRIRCEYKYDIKTGMRIGYKDSNGARVEIVYEFSYTDPTQISNVILTSTDVNYDFNDLAEEFDDMIKRRFLFGARVRKFLEDNSRRMLDDLNPDCF